MPQTSGPGQFERKMLDVSDMNIKCAECGTDIKELPFKPDPSRKIYCQDCYRKVRQNR